MGKRVLFTKREIENYSKTHEGRQYMNLKRKNVGLTSMIVGTVLLIFSIVISNQIDFIDTGVSFLIFLPAVYMLLHGFFSFWVYRSEYINEEKAEQLREKERLAKKDALRRAPFSQIDAMNGFKFEEYCTAVLEGLGYKSKQTKKSGDFGADIILEKDNSQIIV